MRGVRWAVIFFIVLLGWSCGDRQAGASVVLVTDQSTYNQDTSGLTTINFNSFVPSGQLSADYSTSTGLVSGSVDFVGGLSSGTWDGGNNYLYAVTPGFYFPNSPAVLQGPPSVVSSIYNIAGTLNVTLGGSYSAVGSGLFVIQTAQNGATSGSVMIAVMDLSGTYDFTITTAAQGINFIGFLSDSRITSIQYTSEGPQQQFPNLSNFSYGFNASAVPEPSSLMLLGFGGAVALGLALRRRVSGRRARS